MTSNFLQQMAATDKLFATKDGVNQLTQRERLIPVELYRLTNFWLRLARVRTESA
jgi:hypothetical protein